MKTNNVDIQILCTFAKGDNELFPHKKKKKKYKKLYMYDRNE